MDEMFSESMIKTNIDNIFVMIKTSIMLGDIDRVKHYVSSEIYEKYVRELKELKNKNLRHMFDELNVKSTEILEKKIEGGKLVVDVLLVSRVMDYYTDINTGEFISGNNKKRVEESNYLTFERKVDSKDGVVAKCPNCGASMDINYTSVCKYCGQAIEADENDWVLVKI